MLKLGRYLYQLDELGGFLPSAVVQPAAAVDHVVFLENAEAAPDRRRVREDKHLPAVFGGVLFEQVFEPRDLDLVHGHLAR